MTEAMRVANFSADWGPIFAKMYDKWKKMTVGTLDKAFQSSSFNSSKWLSL